MSRVDLDAQRASFNTEFSGASENIAVGNGEYWGPYYPLRWGQWQKAWQAALASQAPAVQQGDAEDAPELDALLTVFDIGLAFALCHRDFGDTRNAVKKLQQDFIVLRAAIDAARKEK